MMDATINSLDGNGTTIRWGKERENIKIGQPETKTGGAMRRRNDLDGKLEVIPPDIMYV